MSTPSATLVAPRTWRWPTLLSSRGHAVGAWSIWAGLLVAACWFVLRYGFTLPYRDELDMVGIMLGEQPVTLAWLWSLHNEHRLFVPRLLYLGLTWLTSGNLPQAALYNTLSLAAASACLMFAARQLRGHTSLCDAVFPLALLHWGHFTNLLWLFQLAFATSICLTCLLLVSVVRTGPQLSLRRAWFISLCLMLMVLCGAYGVAYVPAMSLWLGLAAFETWKRGGQRRFSDCLLTAVAAGLPAALVGLYFMGYVRPTAPSGLDWLAWLRTSLEVLSTCLGLAARQVWPLSGIVILIALVGSVYGLARLWVKRPHERLRCAGLFCFLAGVLTLALGIGWGRAALGSGAGLADRYILLATPLLCLWYLQAVWQGEAGGRRLQAILFVVMCVLVTVNLRKGSRNATDFHARFVAIEKDIRAGLPSAGLACRHNYFYPSESALCARLESLRQARFGVFAEVNTLGPLRETTVSSLAPLPQWSDAAGQIRLAGGESMSRQFRVSAGCQLSRIDVQAGRWRKGRMFDKVYWTLSSLEQDQQTPIRQGEADLTQLVNQRFLNLDFTPFYFDADTALELTFHAPATGSDLYVEFPTYRADGSSQQELNVFFFTRPAAALSQAPASARR